MSSPDRTSTIIVDVEGVMFKTRISTLINVTGCYFDKLFAKDWRRMLDREGHLFLDRDATVFPVLLNFMRDGSKIPLPADEYFLARIQHEANHFGLHDLADLVEKRMSLGEIKPSYSSLSPKKERSVTFEAKPILVTATAHRRHSAEVPIPTRKTMEKRSSPLKRQQKAVGSSVESISLPRNFAHVAHVGWNGNGVIFEKHLLGDESTVRAIIDAAQRQDITPIYNVVNGNSDDHGSHSVEVILTGPHIQKACRDERSKANDGRESASSNGSGRETDLMRAYSKPSKRPPRTPPKPPLSRSVHSTF